MTLAHALDTVLALPPWLMALLLFGSSLVEYVFPPFPGDTITLAGAVLAARGAVPIWLGFAAVTAGGVVGCAAVLAAGGALATWHARREGARGAAAVDDLVQRFRRHGAAYIVINRFLPGIRAFFFVAAGLARLPRGKVLAWATISLVLYNALLTAAGLAIGHKLEDLDAAFRTYQTVTWVVVGLVVLLVAWRIWRKRNNEAL